MTVESPFTLRAITEEARESLHSFVGQEQKTSLAAPMTDSELTFQVAGEVLVSRGMVEIGDELVYVAAVDTTTGTATVEPWGRAQSGSTAASHATGAKVTMAPLYPLQRLAGITAAIMREIFPMVFAVDETELDINPARSNYVLPSDAYQVLSVEWNWPGPSGMWVPVQRWRQNKPVAGLELEILSPVWPGEGRVRAKYAKTPKSSWDLDDDLSTYGYDFEIRDVVVLGTVARAMAYTEPGRIQAQSLESHGRSEAVPAGAAHTAARYFLALFRQRLDEERAQILLRHPIQPHRTR